MGDSFEQANEILSITQNLNFFENIFHKLNNFEMGEYQHYFFCNFSLMIRRGNFKFCMSVQSIPKKIFTRFPSVAFTYCAHLLF